ncbi:MAG TPA: hypothetical protein VGY75_11115 [Candidatus Udaeobacter sp.]|jgi:hypothetical protein|nr:hypothetical protein [Candidatus Udaeobacter sp.]
MKPAVTGSSLNEHNRIVKRVAEKVTEEASPSFDRGFRNDFGSLSLRTNRFMNSFTVGFAMN